MFRFYGIGESKLETELAPLIDGQTDPTFATYAKEGECSLRVASKRTTIEEAKSAVLEAGDKVRVIVGDYLYSDDDEELYEVVVRRLLEKGLSISTAESCTGGMFASTLISYVGASAVFDRGFVTYSNESKTRELAVPAAMIDEHGAVSEEVAAAMAKGAFKRAGTDIAMAVTGVSGPDGGTEEKPVGMSWIAIADRGGVITKKYRRMKDRGRNANRRVTVLAMLDMLNRYLKDL
jgi:nicotinamide-nucleotide amidase